jgi:hypothetical protein
MGQRNNTTFKSGLFDAGSGLPLNRYGGTIGNVGSRTWPNIISTSTTFPTSTGPFATTVRYQDYDSASTITVRLDNDRNPHNNFFDFLSPDLAWKTRASKSIATKTGSGVSEDSLTWTNSGVPTGDYWVNTEISDGQQTRSFYSPTKIAITNTGTTAATGGGTSPVVTVPATPTQLSAVATSASSISLAWQDKSNNESGFRIERKVGSGGSWAPLGANKAANSTTHTDAGLSSGTNYHYRVAAFNSAGGSTAFSNEASATTQAVQGTTFALNIQSSNPSSGVNVYTSLSDWTQGVSGTTNTSRNFAAGTTVNVSCAAAAPGVQQFQKWQLDGADYAFSPATSITMNGPRTLTAVFGSSPPPTRTLTNLSISGPGTVNEGSSGQFTATAHFSDGGQQTVTPSPWGTNFGAPGTISSAGVFTGGAVTSDTIVTINASYTSGVVPKFATKDIVVRRVASQQTFTLTTNAVHGSITRSPNLTSYTAGSVVVVTVSANPGYFFANWTGASTSPSSSITVVMDSNKTLTAQFGVGATPGSLVVNISPPEVVAAGAQWRFGEYEPWNNSGTPVAPTHNGDHSIQLKEIAGWTRPFPNVVKISTGVTNSINVSYIQHPGTLQVVLQPADAIAVGAQWRVDGGAWQNSGANVSVLPGSRAIEFKAAGTWATPPPQAVTITANQSAVVHGNYVPPLGQPVIASISPPNGPLEGGTAVTIEGVNFASGAVVRFGTVNATTVIVNSSSSITAFTPALESYGTVSVEVSSGSQSASVANGFTYAVPRGVKLDLLGQLGGAVNAVELAGTLAWIGEGSSLVAVNISNLSSLSAQGRIGLPDMVMDIAVSGTYAYTANEDAGVQVVDISNPNAPASRGFFDTPGQARCISLLGGRAYVADGTSGLQILDLTNPLALTRLGGVDTPGGARWVEIVARNHGVYALVADESNSLQVIDVSNPASPSLSATLNVGNRAVCLGVSGIYAYIGDDNQGSTGGVKIVNITDPRAPTLVGTMLGSWGNSPCYALSISSGKLWLGGLTISSVYSLANPENPTSGSPAPPGILSNCAQIAGSGNIGFVADGAGLKTYDVSNTSVPVARGSYVSPIGFALRHHSNASHAFVCDQNRGLRSVGLSNPALPTLVGARVVTNPRSENVFLFGSKAFLCLGSSGFQTISVSSPASPSLDSTFTPSDGGYVIDCNMSGSVGAYTGASLSTQNGRFGLFDTSNPAAPSLRGQINLSATNDYQPGWGVAIRNGYAYVANSNLGLRIIDISNINSPVIRGSFTAPNTRGVAISNDGNFAYVASGDGFRVIDISNPNSPSLVSKTLSDVSCFDVAVNGRLAFVAATNRGVVVFDLTNPVSPQEVASYDTPWSAWGVDVIDDVVTVSDGYGGLLCLRLADAQLPTVVITNPVFDPTFNSTIAMLTLAGSASDNKGVAKVFWVNNRGGSGEATGTTDWNTGNVQLYPGQNVINVTALDTAGNRSSDVLTVTYSPPDVVPPLVRLAVPQSSDRIFVGTDLFTLTGTANDNVALTEIIWSSDRGFSGTASGTTLWSVLDAPLLEGDNVFTVTARDIAGNTSTDRATLVMVPPDLEAPTLAMHFPTLDPLFETPTSPLSLAGIANDNTGVAAVSWMNHRGGQGAAEGRETWAIPSVPLKAGLNVITVMATDRAGNSTSTVLTVVHSPSRIPNRPVAIIRKPASGARIENETALVEGRASAREGVNAVLYQVNDGPWLVADGGTAWSFTASLAPGLNAVRVKTLDVFGVESLVVTRLFTRVVRGGLVIETVGDGTVVCSGFTVGQELEIGRNYTVTARPAKGWMFAGWSGGLVSVAPKMTFTMRAGLETTATFVENPFDEIGGAYLGLAQSDTVSHETNGLLRASVSTSGGFSATLLLGGQSHRLSGKFDTNGYWTGQIRRSKQPPLSVLLMLDVGSDSETLSGIIAAEGLNTAIDANRAVFHARDSPAPHAGTFTFAIEPDTSPTQAPVGYGAGTLVIDAAGKTTVKGRLADGATLTFSGYVSREGTWPLYAALYSASGSIAGKGLFADLPGSDTSALLYWFKPQRLRDARFKDGFECRPGLFAQRYSQPLITPARLLPQWDANGGNGTLRLLGPDLLTELLQPLIWQTDNKFSQDASVVQGLRWTPVAKTGLFSGSFMNPQTQKLLPMSGALLQKTGEGLGWFQGPVSTGAVLLESTP